VEGGRRGSDSVRGPSAKLQSALRSKARARQASPRAGSREVAAMAHARSATSEARQGMAPRVRAARWRHGLPSRRRRPPGCAGSRRAAAGPAGLRRFLALAGEGSGAAGLPGPPRRAPKAWAQPPQGPGDCRAGLPGGQEAAGCGRERSLRRRDRGWAWG